MKLSLSLLSGLVAVAPSSVLAERLAVTAFSGPGAAAVRAQLTAAACEAAECVDEAKVTSRGAPDWKKARQAAVRLLITGAVSAQGKGRTLDLQVLDGPGPARARRTYPVERSGTLSASNLEDALVLVRGALVPAPAAPAAEAPVRTASIDAPAPPAAAAPERPAPATEAPATTTSDPAPLRLAVELGTSLLSRSFSYDRPTSNNLRQYSIFPLPPLDVRAEFYPLALVRGDALAGLGVELSIAVAPALRSRLASAMETYPTSTVRVAGGVRFRWAPFAAYRAVFIPLLGVNVRSFSVGAAPSGATLDGLPNVSFFGLRAGLGVELPVLERRLAVIGRFCVLPTFSSGPLISAAYFPKGSTFGLEASAGLSLRLLTFLSLRVTFELEQYGSSFSTAPTDTFVAAGSLDRSLGGSAALRLEL
jgi:hypothetical protein